MVLFTKAQTFGAAVLILLLASTAPLATPAHAAKRGRVLVDTPLLRGRQEGAPIIQNIRAGSPVLTSDRAVDGYYKAKTREGKIGFIKEEAVRVAGVPTVRERRAAESIKPGPRARLFLGSTLFSASDFAALVQISTGVKNGAQIGGDFSLHLTPKLFGVLRIEKISKSFSATTSDPLTYDFSLSSMPIMVGAGYVLSKGESFLLEGQVLGGMGMGTGITGTGTDGTAEYKESPTTFMLKLDGSYMISEQFSFFAELGYRMLSTSALTPTGTAGNLYRSGGELVPVKINLSGPVIGFGLGYRF